MVDILFHDSDVGFHIGKFGLGRHGSCHGFLDVLDIFLHQIEFVFGRRGRQRILNPGDAGLENSVVGFQLDDILLDRRDIGFQADDAFLDGDNLLARVGLTHRLGDGVSHQLGLGGREFAAFLQFLGGGKGVKCGQAHARLRSGSVAIH